MTCRSRIGSFSSVKKEGGGVPPCRVRVSITGDGEHAGTRVPQSNRA